MTGKKTGTSNGLPKMAWKVLVVIAVVVTIVASMWGQDPKKPSTTPKKIIDFLNREPKQKFILQGLNGNKYRVPVTVLENNRYGQSKKIRLITSEYEGGSTWYLSHKWEQRGTMVLSPSSKYPNYNYGGYWEDKDGRYPIWFKFNKERTKATGKVYLYKKWHNCWLKL